MSGPVRTIADDRDAWERQPGESTKAFAAFCSYRDFGPARSHLRVADEVGRHRTQIGGWSTKFQWMIRVDAYDADQEQRARVATERARTRMVEKHASQASAALNAAMAPVVKFLQRLRDRPEELDEAETKDLAEMSIKFLRSVTPLQQAERVARGLPATSTEIVGDPERPLVARRQPVHDLSKLSVPELEVFAWLLEKVEGNEEGDEPEYTTLQEVVEAALDPSSRWRHSVPEVDEEVED
jgi:hypothetical protein